MAPTTNTQILLTDGSKLNVTETPEDVAQAIPAAGGILNLTDKSGEKVYVNSSQIIHFRRDPTASGGGAPAQNS